MEGGKPTNFVLLIVLSWLWKEPLRQNKQKPHQSSVEPNKNKEHKLYSEKIFFLKHNIKYDESS